MKKTTTALLGFGYLALGLSMSGATGAWTAPTDTNEVRVEIDGIDPEAGLLEAITEIVKISTTRVTKLSAQIAEIQALVEAGTLTEEEGEARTEALTEDFESRMENVGESMEEWGEELGERMEAWAEEFGKKWESNDKAMDDAIGDAVERDLKTDLDFDAPEAP
jgi:hypothetical protein